MNAEPARSLHRLYAVGLLLLATLGLTACSPRLALVRSLADELARPGATEETDLGLAREAAAFSLKFSEGVLRETPGHLGLAEAVASGFVQYAYAFVAEPAERLEARDADTAQAERLRAARLYRRARDHALRALELQQPGLQARLAAWVAPAGGTAPPAAPPALAPELASLAYWAAAAWGAEISLSKDDPDVVADLPQAQALAEAAWRARPEVGQGALASLLGMFEAGRPGGSPVRAQAWFDRALALAGPQGQAAPRLAQAEHVLAPAGDRAAFEAAVRQALAATQGRHDLMHQVLARRAHWLLGRLDEMF